MFVYHVAESVSGTLISGQSITASTGTQSATHRGMARMSWPEHLV